MMPVVKGEDITLRQIIGYTFALVLTSFTFVLFEGSWIYFIIALIMGVLFIKKAFLAQKYRIEKNFKGLFSYSIIYLLTIFIVIIIDKVLFQIVF